MNQTHNTITREAFVARPLDASTYYDYLPSDTIAITSDIPPLNLKTLLALLNEGAPSEKALDDAIICLLTHNFDGANADPALLEAIVLRTSYMYAALLKGVKSHRGLRMRLQHINFCLQDILDTARIIVPDVRTQATHYRSPWDFLPDTSGAWWVTSDKHNVIYEGANSENLSFICGLPSQIDRIDDTTLSVGSIFSDGCWLITGTTPVHVAHTLPLVLVWNDNNIRYGIDHRGHIYTIAANCATKPVGSIGVEEVSKCRRIGNILYLFDWTDPEHMWRVQLGDWSAGRLRVPKLLLGNDILLHNEQFYMIDKQQGRVFTYDKNFVFIKDYLAFGKSPGKLFDPICLRHHNAQLHIINWLSATHIQFPMP